MPRHARHLSALAALGVCLLLPAPARAIGTCEELAFSSTLVAYAPQRGLLLHEGAEELCHDEDDTRLTLPFVRATTADGEPVAYFYAPHAGAAWPSRAALDAFTLRAGDLPDAPDAPGDPHVAARAAVDAYRAAEGFVPVAALGPAPGSGCAVRAAPAQEAIPEDEGAHNGFPATDMQVTVQVGDAVVAQKRHADVATLEGALRVVPIFTPDRQALLVWTSTPRCEGGPPPGYFGEDDPGDCYLKLHEEVTRYAVADHPALAACWQDPAAAGLPPSADPRSGGCASCAVAPPAPLPWPLPPTIALAALLIARRRRP